MRHATAAVILVVVTRPSLPGSREIRFFRSRVARVMLRLAVPVFFKKREAVVLREESNTAVECISRADTCQAMLAWRTSCLRLILATDNVCARADVRSRSQNFRAQVASGICASSSRGVRQKLRCGVRRDLLQRLNLRLLLLSGAQ